MVVEYELRCTIIGISSEKFNALQYSRKEWNILHPFKVLVSRRLFKQFDFYVKSYQEEPTAEIFDFLRIRLTFCKDHVTQQKV